MRCCPRAVASCRRRNWKGALPKKTSCEGGETTKNPCKKPTRLAKEKHPDRTTRGPAIHLVCRAQHHGGGSYAQRAGHTKEPAPNEPPTSAESVPSDGERINGYPNQESINGDRRKSRDMEPRACTVHARKEERKLGAHPSGQNASSCKRMKNQGSQQCCIVN